MDSHNPKRHTFASLSCITVELSSSSARPMSAIIHVSLLAFFTLYSLLIGGEGFVGRIGDVVCAVVGCVVVLVGACEVVFEGVCVVFEVVCGVECVVFEVTCGVECVVLEDMWDVEDIFIVLLDDFGALEVVDWTVPKKEGKKNNVKY